jgi:hypothetical protein
MGHKKDRATRAGKMKAIKAINTGGIMDPTTSTSNVTLDTKKRNAPVHECSSTAQKTSKKTRLLTPLPHAGKCAENVEPSLQRTPNINRMVTHANLISEKVVHAPDMETRIMAEACGVTRKNIPLAIFRSAYLCGFSVKAQSKLVVESVKKIGQGNWEEKQFAGRLRQTLSDKVRCSRRTLICLFVLC